MAGGVRVEPGGLLRGRRDQMPGDQGTRALVLGRTLRRPTPRDPGWNHVHYALSDYGDLLFLLSNFERETYLPDPKVPARSHSGDAVDQERQVLALLANGAGAWLLPVESGPTDAVAEGPSPSRAHADPKADDPVDVRLGASRVLGGWHEPDLTRWLRGLAGTMRECFARHADGGTVLVLRLAKDRSGPLDVRTRETDLLPATVRCVSAAIHKASGLPDADRDAEAEYWIRFLHGPMLQ